MSVCVCACMWEVQEPEEGRSVSTATPVFGDALPRFQEQGRVGGEILDSELRLIASENAGHDTSSHLNVSTYIFAKQAVKNRGGNGKVFLTNFG